MSTSRVRRVVDLCIRTPGAACFVLGAVAVFLTFKNGFPPVVGIALGVAGLILLGAGELILLTQRGRDDEAQRGFDVRPPDSGGAAG